MGWINKLDRKFGRGGIPHLMYYVTATMLAVFLIELLFPQLGIAGWLYFDRALILQGQLWRLITFAFLPPSSSVLWIVLSLYFYCLIGNALESEWGTFRFNVFYLCGIVGNILAGFVTGSAVNSVLNLSLFLAFAILYPNYQVMLFFILPIKVKYLALLDALYFAVQLIFGSWTVRLAVVVSLLNILLFFGGDFINTIRRESSYWKTRYNFRRNNRY